MEVSSLQDFSPLNDPDDDGYDCNNEKDMYETSGAVCEKSDGPSDDEDYRDDIK